MLERCLKYLYLVWLKQIINLQANFNKFVNLILFGKLKYRGHND